jgi:2'-hydroxyisoflavone reductase
MKLLVVGGTRFFGRHLVEQAAARGDEVTVFTRGQSGGVPPGVEHRIGDRRADLSALGAGTWDAVVDTCGYLPSEVDALAARLRGRVRRYLFVSSVSVYASSTVGNSEGDALGVIDDPGTTTVDGRTYGPLKALCEAAVQRHFGSAATVLRPGLIVGPFDPTQRFTYWPARIARARDGEPVLVPGRPEDPLQVIDARDLAAFALALIDGGHGGAFNAVSEAFTWADLLAACASAAGVQPAWAWRPVAELQALGIEPWSDLPLALPDDAEHRGFMRTDVRRALAAGLRTRPLTETVADTLAWWRALPDQQQVFDKAGLAPEREAEALRAPAV